RNNEVNGIDYYFVTRDEFTELIKQNKFVEYAEVYGNYYGTLKTNLETNFSKQIDMIFDIDTQGAYTLKSYYPNQTVLIYILPPSFSSIEQRLKNRQSDYHNLMQARLATDQKEILKADKYDYIIINDDIEEALVKLKSVIIAERSKTNRL